MYGNDDHQRARAQTQGEWDSAQVAPSWIFLAFISCGLLATGNLGEPVVVVFLVFLFIIVPLGWWYNVAQSNKKTPRETSTQLETVSGLIRLHRVPATSNPDREYIYQIRINNSFFQTNADIFHSIVEKESYTLYYVPSSRRVVRVEPHRKENTKTGKRKEKRKTLPTETVRGTVSLEKIDGEPFPHDEPIYQIRVAGMVLQTTETIYEAMYDNHRYTLAYIPESHFVTHAIPHRKAKLKRS